MVWLEHLTPIFESNSILKLNFEMTDFDIDQLMSTLERKKQQNMNYQQSAASNNGSSTWEPRPSTAPQTAGNGNPHANPPPGQKGSFWNKIWMRSADAKVKLQESDKKAKKSSTSTKPQQGTDNTPQGTSAGYPPDLSKEQLEAFERARQDQAERARKEAELKRLERELQELAMRVSSTYIS